MKTMKSTALAGGVLILSIAGYIAYLYPVPTSLPVEMKYLADCVCSAIECARDAVWGQD